MRGVSSSPDHGDDLSRSFQVLEMTCDWGENGARSKIDRDALWGFPGKSASQKTPQNAKEKTFWPPVVPQKNNIYYFLQTPRGNGSDNWAQKKSI